MAGSADTRQTNADSGQYYFSATGLGPGGYNCSKMAAEIVQAAGVDASSGLLFDTPGELALGTKAPNDALLLHRRDGNLDEEANAYKNVFKGL